MKTLALSWCATRLILSRVVSLALVLCAILAIFAINAGAETFKIIYRLTYSVEGNSPTSPLLRDSAGNLYGTTEDGANPTCADGCGAAFELSPTSQGGWKNTVLHKFTGGDDGNDIYGGLAMDSAGNLYGTAANGGKYGQGNVFEISPLPNGGWKFAVLYPFQGLSDGGNPTHGVILDASGNLYGVSNTTVFELSPVAGGGWKHSVLHHFAQDQEPAGVTFDASGNIFGATSAGGISNPNCFNGCGTVYELTKGTTYWKYKSLYSFTGGADGGVPTGQVILDALGNIYGITNLGGNVNDCSNTGCGTVFELTSSGGVWSESVLFAFNYTDGSQPNGPLVFDASGNLYGTAHFDNANNCGCGVVYELSPGSGGWTQTVLHTFKGGADGKFPGAGLIPDGSGSYYGTTQSGGNTTQAGTIFFLTP